MRRRKWGGIFKFNWGEETSIQYESHPAILGADVTCVAFPEGDHHEQIFLQRIEDK